MLIGLSLAQCISDIRKGLVKIKDVEKIHVSVDMPNLFSLLAWIKKTSKTFNLGSYFTPLAIFLWFIGKIDNPISRGEKPYYFISGGTWADKNRDVFYYDWENKKRIYSNTKLIREQDINKRTIHVGEDDYFYIALDNSVYITHENGDYIPVDQYNSLVSAIEEKEKIVLVGSHWYLIQKVHQHEIHSIKNESGDGSTWLPYTSYDVPQIIIDSLIKRRPNLFTMRHK